MTAKMQDAFTPAQDGNCIPTWNLKLSNRTNACKRTSYLFISKVVDRNYRWCGPTTEVDQEWSVYGLEKDSKDSTALLNKSKHTITFYEMCFVKYTMTGFIIIYSV